MNEYEKKRVENIENNKRILRELGLEKPPIPLSSPVVTRKTTRKKNKKKDSYVVNSIVPQASTSNTSLINSLRRSSRIANNPDSHKVNALIKVSITKKNWRENRPDPKQIGHIPGYEVEEEGAISVALSGGYEDDVDWGDAFTYTGSGGRDLKGTKYKPKNLRTAPQDQALIGGNLALKVSCETGNPVRVIRGYKLNNEYAPKEGYRYDGLYKVEKWWEEIGLSGFRVFKYAFKRFPDQPPLGTCLHEFTDSEDDSDNNDGGSLKDYDSQLDNADDKEENQNEEIPSHAIRSSKQLIGQKSTDKKDNKKKVKEINKDKEVDTKKREGEPESSQSIRISKRSKHNQKEVSVENKEEEQESSQLAHAPRKSKRNQKEDKVEKQKLSQSTRTSQRIKK
ncbi:6722_t:CDS:2 [Diversispora eburnea]|uniref:6722_t:CDS:1 n=1 Tax=Diversispora eburnea TaxID=1213867 RepID=A0A9N8YR09_9GLOM|nr:6722_t:CDS:2 [Diversispora eburnea]